MVKFMKKFLKNPSKQYKKIYRFYPQFMYHRLDKWLKQMSAKGWHIVHCGIFYFLFEKGVPLQKEYFTYSVDAPLRSEGRFSISMRYPFLKSHFGVKKKKSKINSNSNKAYQIVEIDVNKVADYEYAELKEDRNRLYKIKAIINVSVFILMLILGFTILIISSACS